MKTQLVTSAFICCCIENDTSVKLFDVLKPLWIYFSQNLIGKWLGHKGCHNKTYIFCRVAVLKKLWKITFFGKIFWPERPGGGGGGATPTHPSESTIAPLCANVHHDIKIHHDIKWRDLKAATVDWCSGNSRWRPVGHPYMSVVNLNPPPTPPPPTGASNPTAIRLYSRVVERTTPFMHLQESYLPMAR